MNKLFSTCVIIFLMCLYANAQGQDRTFNFEDELCSYKGYFNAGIYTEEQLRDTYKLVQGYYSIYSEDEQQLDDNYKNTKHELINLNIVKNPYFHALKDSILKFIELTYQIKKVEFNAINGHKKDLLQHYQHDETVKLYSEALFKGGDDLMKAYAHLTKEQMKNNGSPERIWNEYTANSKSNQAQQIAFKRVLTYGWWNAVNNLLPHINFDGTQFQAFQKLFIKVETLDCEEF